MAVSTRRPRSSASATITTRCPELTKPTRRPPGRARDGSRSQPYYLDVTHKDANKGAVVAYLADTAGVPPTEIATIGDQPNDVLMFKPSGLSIAMGNASDEVKVAGQCTTNSYNDEGFGKAIERFVLPSVGSEDRHQTR